MPDAPDIALVREFARGRSEVAFAELVRRHIALVYSVARRFTGNPGDAEDVTQAVFILLARKAAGLRARVVLAGWLYETTRFTAARLLRANARRRAREQEAGMQSALLNETAAPRRSETDADAVWEKLAPHLEAAMSKLAERDRTLLVLRFYENKTGPEAAALLGIREAAAHKRAARALEKLRKFFNQRGIDSTAETIAETISANSVQAAPVALAKTVTAVALAKGATASISTLTVIKGVLKIMAWTKAKITIVSVASVLLVGGTTAIAVKQIRERIRLKAVSEYHGQPVTYWLDQVFLGFPKSSAQETYAALRQLGAPAAAPLVQALTLTNSPPGSPFPDFHDIRQNVFAALEQMGPAAKSQVPELIQLLKHPDMKVRVFATLTLADIGPEAKAAIPALMEESQDLTNGITQPSGVHARDVFTPLAPYAQEALRRIESK